MSNSSTSRYESENRRYQRTAQTMTSGSKCRHLNSAGRGLIMGYTAAYQTRSLSFCNTAVDINWRWAIRSLKQTSSTSVSRAFFVTETPAFAMAMRSSVPPAPQWPRGAPA
jgi:hypothetical protein